MSDPFIGQIQLFGFDFAPRGWAACNGAIMPLRQFSALFSLLGTQYGGDGVNTFALPNFANRAACHRGPGPGLTPREIGASFGSNQVTLTPAQMPAHTHALQIYGQNDPSKRASSPSPGNALGTPVASAFAPADSANAPFAPNVIGPAGNGLSHENRQPYLATNFCIALDGVFPAFE
jgi:microcystin-dependent protein